MLFRQKMSTELVIGLTYRLDGSLFKLNRFHNRTKPTYELITELQYADVYVLVAHTPGELQEPLECLSSM